MKSAMSVALFFLFPGFIMVFVLNAPLLSKREYRAGTHAIYDMDDKPIYLQQRVQKGMVFAPVAEHFITADNSADHLIALAAYIKQAAAQNMLGKIFPDLPYRQEAFTSEVNHQPVGVEQTLLLQPDMVLLYDHQAGPFEAAGFNGLARIVSPVRKHYQKIFKMFGYLTGKTQRTQDIFLRKQVLLEKLFASIPSPKDMSPVTMLTLSHERLHLFPSLFEDYNINLKLLNAVNLAEKTVAQGAVNTEALLKLNPDVIFLYNYRNQLTVQDIYNNRALAGLSAVRNKRVYRMPNGASRMTGPVEEPLLFYWMSQLLHPEAMPIVPFRQLVKDTYSEIFGYMPTEADVDYVLSIHENQFSAYYDKFAACGVGI